MIDEPVEAATPTEFNRHVRTYLHQVAGGGRPLVIPVAGTAGVVIMDIGSWTQLKENAK